ncbi:MAG: hypothetical protein AAF802_17260 [Planctomycetota bacterium]
MTSSLIIGADSITEPIGIVPIGISVPQPPHGSTGGQLTGAQLTGGQHGAGSTTQTGSGTQETSQDCGGQVVAQASVDLHRRRLNNPPAAAGPTPNATERLATVAQRKPFRTVRFIGKAPRRDD